MCHLMDKLQKQGRSKPYVLQYDDGDHEELDLDKETWRMAPDSWQVAGNDLGLSNYWLR